MKTHSTALTRPRSAFGVAKATVVERMLTLIMSAKPQTPSATSESANECERPKTIVATPNSVTVASSAGPTRASSGRRGVEGLGRDREQEPAGGGARDDAELRRGRAQGEGRAEVLCGDELRRQGSCCRRPERRRSAAERREHEKRPETIGRRERDDEEERRRDERDRVRERDDQPTRIAAGELARRQREQRDREELRDADEAEVERVLVDRVDLPPDADRDDLG